MPRRLVAALVAVAVLGGCAGSGDGDSPESGSDGGSLTWEECDALECATLEVLVDHAEPDGPTIGLALVRAPAGDPDERIGSLVVNPGGPGGSGTELVAGGFTLGPEVSERFDIVGFDPRGVGDSARIDCGDAPDELFDLDPDPDGAAEQDALDEAAAAVVVACGADAGGLLDHVATPAVVGDLELLRQALGEDPLSFLGYSYGTLIGQLYAEAHPERLRALVLDGVVDPAQDLPELLAAQTEGFAATFDAMVAACTEDPDCPLDDLAATYDDLAARVETDPIPAGDGDEVGPAELTLAAVYAGYDDSPWPVFADALTEAAEGDGALLAGFAAAYRGAASYGPYASVTCTDSPHPPNPEAWEDLAAELDAIDGRFGSAIATELLPCATWEAPVARQPAPATAEGAPLTLVVGTTGDPPTPFANAEKVAATLDDAALLTHEGGGHTSFSEPDCRDVVARYLVDLSVPPPGATC